MAEGTGNIGVFVFRGVEYIVTSHIPNGNSLVIEVEDRLSADQWRGSFDVAYIEDMTHKTGNFKQFSIFVSMLETAITQTSDVVSLDLLTYADLESLRNRKSGSVGSRNIPPPKNAVVLGSKRYIILTYTVEFDRIHYPLPLPYVGKPDPRALQDTIRQLQQDIKHLQTQGTKDYRVKEIDKLKKERDIALKEKEAIEAEYLTFRREVQSTREGSAVKEIRSLKTVIQHLEEDLMEDRSKHQKSSTKRSQAYRNLLDEVEELRASERNLKVRVKSLTNELAIFRRQGRINTSAARRNSGSRENSINNSRFSNNSRHSRDRSYESRSNSYTRGRRFSQERSFDKTSRSYDRTSRLSQDRSNSTERSYTRNRSHSNEGPFSKIRSTSVERGRSLERPLSAGRRSRTPSPAISLTSSGSRYPKFDPTAFVKEKERKKRESELQRKRRDRARMNGSSPSDSDRIPAVRSRTSSVGSLRSRTSSIESLSDIIPSDASDGRKVNGVLKTRKFHKSKNIPSSPDVSFTKPSTLKNGSKTKKILASTPENDRTSSRKKAWEKENKQPSHGESDYYDRSKEILDIDARLSRLQQFMKTNLPLS